MTTINSNRITGLATGMDIDEMVTNMLTGEQNKVDKAEQKKKTQTWQQEIYRDVISDVKGLYDKYFSATSSDYILSSKVFSNMTVNSSNSSVITATASAGASSVNYKFEVSQLATAPKVSSNVKGLTKGSELNKLGLAEGTTFKISYGNGKESSVITVGNDETVESLIKKINLSTYGEIKAAFSEMTGKFSIESKTTGAESSLKIVTSDSTSENETISDALNSLGISGDEIKGQNSKVNVFDSSGNIIKTDLENTSNTFTLDGITYNLHGTNNE